MDLRKAALETYRMMLLFKDKCDCACPGEDGKNVKTSSGAAKPEGIVEEWLETEYPGKNKVDDPFKR